MATVAELRFDVDSRPLRRGEQELEDFGKAANKAERQLDEFTDALKKATNQANRGGFKKAEGGIKSLTRGLGAFGGVATAATAALGTLASAAGGLVTIGALRSIAEFEQQISAVGAVANATGADLERLSAIAREMGATTAFTASQAAEGLQFLAMAGFSVNEAISALPATLNLAAAGALDLGTAADIASNVLTAFNLEAEQTGRVADILAQAASSSNTSVEQLGQGFKFVGSVAGALNVSMETTAAAMSVLSNAGMQAEMAGTGLRRILVGLADPSEELAQKLDGVSLEADGLVGVISKLAEEGVTATEAMEEFGLRGGPAVLNLVRAFEDLEQFELDNLDAAGRAAEIASQRLDNLAGDVTQLQSAFGELLLSIGDDELNGAARELVQTLTGAFRSEDAKQLAEVISDVLTVGVQTLNEELERITTFTAGSMELVDIFRSWGDEIEAVRVGLATIPGPLGDIFRLTNGAANDNPSEGGLLTIGGRTIIPGLEELAQRRQTRQNNRANGELEAELFREASGVDTRALREARQEAEALSSIFAEAAGHADGVTLSVEAGAKALKDAEDAATAAAEALQQQRFGEFLDASGLEGELETLTEFNQLLKESGETVANEYLQGVEDAAQVTDDLAKLTEQAARAGIELTDAQKSSLETLLKNITAQERITDEIEKQREATEELAQSEIGSRFGSIASTGRSSSISELTAAQAAGQRVTQELLQELEDRIGVFEDVTDDQAGDIEQAIREAGAEHAQEVEEALDRAGERLAASLSGLTQSLAENLLFQGGDGFGRILERGLQRVFSDQLLGPSIDAIFSGEGLQGINGVIKQFSTSVEGLASQLGASQGLAGTVGTAAPYAAAAIASRDLSIAAGRNIDGNGISADTERFTQFGGIFAGILGGLLSKESDKFARGIFDANTGSNVFTSNKTGENVGGRDALTDALRTVTQEIGSLTGATFTEQLGFSVGSRDGIQILRNAGLNGGGDGAFRSGNVAFRTEDPEAALREGIRLLVNSLQGGEQQVTDFAKAIVNSGQPLEQMVASLDVFAQAVETGNDTIIGYAEAALGSGRSAERVAEGINKLERALSFTAEETSQVVEAIGAINDAFGDVITDMRSLGQATEELAQKQREALRSLGEQALDEARRINLAAVDQNLARFADLLEQTARRSNDAVSLFDAGAINQQELSFIQSSAGLQIGSFFEGLSEEEALRLGQALGVVEEQFSGFDLATARADLEGELERLTSGAEETARALEESARNMERLAEGLRQTEDDIKRRFSDFNPRQSVVDLQGRVSTLLADARQGNTTALEALPQVVNSLVERGREAFGGTAAFADIRDFGLAALNEAAGIAERIASEEFAQAQNVRSDADLLFDIRAILADERELGTLQNILAEGRLTNALIEAQLQSFVNLLNSPENPANQIDLEAIRAAAIEAVRGVQAEPQSSGQSSQTPTDNRQGGSERGLTDDQIADLFASSTAAEDRQTSILSRVEQTMEDLALEIRRDRTQRLAG